jgi:hypothetical protein
LEDLVSLDDDESVLNGLGTVHGENMLGEKDEALAHEDRLTEPLGNSMIKSFPVLTPAERFA